VGLLRTKSEREAAKAKADMGAEKKLIQATVNTQEYFKPTYFSSQPKSMLLSDATAKRLAEAIHNAWGIFNDAEEKIYGVFRSLTYIPQVSQIAFYYFSEFGEDLAGDLISKLSKAELQTVYNIIQKLKS
jgi:hypothetical protein